MQKNGQHATKRKIQLGDLTQGKLIIQAGLQPNERLITQMQESWALHPTIYIDKQGLYNSLSFSFKEILQFIVRTDFAMTKFSMKLIFLFFCFSCKFFFQHSKSFISFIFHSRIKTKAVLERGIH